MAATSEPFGPGKIEARQIYTAICGRDIPPIVLDRFVAASKHQKGVTN